jgi:asparagine synthase (glutamine-hydrolysing)
MCGIAGILHLDLREPVDFDLLARMTGALAHRGPDDEGFYRKGPVGLGHRRLSIIDLSGGGQPMSNEDDTVWITFNGEIFNFPELRRDLEAAGHRFKTRSDTECIVHLYEEHGPEGCARRLVGQFAFAIWDERARRLFIARDHLGIKPLFFRRAGDRLLFASELKALLEDDSVRRELDADALLDYLGYRYVPSPRTIFRGIQKLPAGHLLVAEAGNVRTTRFWQAPATPRAALAAAGPAPRTAEEAAARLDHILRESVRSQLMSDVPLGAFLSGGIDSTITVGYMAGLMDRPVKTFTIGFREEDFSEVEHARKVAALHGTEHRELVVDPESVDLLPRILRQFDEPFADASAIPTYYLCRMAREDVTVAISGDGGDEGFAGYRRYQWALKYSKLDGLPRAPRKLLFGALSRVLPSSRWRTGARRLALDPALRYAELFGYQGRKGSLSLLSSDLRRRAEARPEHALIQELYRRAGGDEATRLQWVDIETYLPDDILVKTDRMSMAHSLEVRVPLLDHRVIEYALSLPSEWRLGKKVLKEAAGRFIPPDLLHRPKMGFGVPLKNWFRGDWSGYAGDLLLGRRSRERGILDPVAVESLLGDHAAGRANATNDIYALVALEEWCREHLDAPAKSAAARGHRVEEKPGSDQ